MKFDVHSYDDPSENFLIFCVGLVLVSDAIAALGLPPGKHCLGTVEVEINRDMATVAGLETLAGRLVEVNVFQIPILAGSIPATGQAILLTSQIYFCKALLHWIIVYNNSRNLQVLCSHTKSLYTCNWMSLETCLIAAWMLTMS